ncbi:helix-turn-helix domain-containing protein [Streptomyces sioyaensis]|uniref:helix-turn-helix domain-containing protein n=1 Tax=Streptomyces sioyaensis TaxID=67364 RepID=UPI0037994F41
MREPTDFDASTYLELLATEAPPTAFSRPVAAARAAGASAETVSSLRRAERLAEDVRSLFEKRRRRTADVSVLLDTARDLMGADDVETVLRVVTRRMRTLLSLDMSFISLRDPALGVNVVRAADGHTSGLTLGFKIPDDGGLGAYASSHGAPFSTADYLADPDIRHSPDIDRVVQAEGLRAVIAVPLRHPDGSSLGLLYAGGREVRHFGSDENALAGEFGQLVAGAIGKSLKLQQIRAEVDELRADVRRAEDEREGVWRLRDSQSTLLELVLAKADIERFLTVVGQLLGGIVWFEDRAGGESSGAGPRGTGPIPPVPGDRAGDGYNDETVAEEGDGRWVCAVRGAVEYGRLMLSRKAPLTDLEIPVLRSCAQALAVLLQSQAADPAQRDHFLDALLAAQPGVTQLAMKRTQSLGIDLRRPHIVAVARPEGGLTDQDLAWATVHARVEGGLKSHRGDHVVLLLPGTDPSAVGQSVADSYLSATGQLTTVGAAGPGTDPAAAPGLYKQAIRCLDTLTVLGATGRAASPKDLGFLELLLADERDVEGFIGSVIGPLLEYDGRRSADLVTTLEAYYAANGSPTRAGEHLFVHANTVARRLERIGELLGQRWQEPDGALEVQLALRLHRVRGSLWTAERKG